jgi:hypothetical protein
VPNNLTASGSGWFSEDGRFGFEVAGDRLLVHCPPLRPTDLIPLLGTARGFLDHIPRMVLTEYSR